MSKISAYILTKNEEKYIRRCLESIKDVVDEIVIVDGFSSDKTIEICKEYTDKIFLHKFSGNFAEERTISVSHTSYDWILQIDADETLSEDLKKELRNLTQEERYVAHSFARRNYYDKNRKSWTKFAYFPDYQPRLFRKDKVKYNLSRTVMEEAIIDGEINYLPTNLYMNHYVPNKYAFSNFKNQHLGSLKLQSKWYKKDKPELFYIIKMFPVFVRHFIYMFLQNNWYKDGFIGFKASIILALYMAMVNYYIAFEKDIILIPLKIFEINNPFQKELDSQKEKDWDKTLYKRNT